MKCIRKILKILRVSWTQKKTNESILEAAGAEQDLLNLIKRKKLSYFGRVMRKEGDCLEKETMQGTVPEARKQGGQGCDWLKT